MKTEKIDLYEYFDINRPSGGRGYLTTYVIERSAEFSKNRLRPAMLVIPGGGYGMVSAREEEPFALYYLSHGFDAFTLNYSVAPVAFPYQLLEACMAMAYIRENADEFGIDKERVSAIGFSAGGHLCGMLATICDEKEIKDFLGEKVNSCRPNAVVLSYPVISAGEFAHKGSIINLSGGREDVISRVSLEERVDKNSAPAFIWATVNDECVPMENSVLMAMAYKKVGVPFELHIFEDGRHGLALCSKETCWVSKAVEKWLDISLIWLENRGFTVKD